MGITIYDIAKNAAVSPATVSRVLNGSTLVSERMREHVLGIAKQLGYSRILDNGYREPAKGLSIAVFISSILNPTLAQMVKGVQSVLKDEGISMVLFDSDGKSEDEFAFLQQIEKYGVSGLILSSPHFSSNYIMLLRQIKLPFVLAFGYSSDPSVPCVYINHAEAAFKMVQRLFEMGHRRISFISGPVGDLTINRERLQGCKLAFLGRDLPFSPDYVVEGDYSVESGYTAANFILEHWKKPPTAIFAFNDSMAIGALNALREKGIKVPDEIALAGFDGIEFASLVHPRLSTVVQPCFQIGRELAEMLLRLMNDENIEFLKKEMPYELVMRESTGIIINHS